MKVEIINDKILLHDYLIRDKYLHLYEIGDLDDFFFGETVWYSGVENGDAKAIALLYNGLSTPTLIALTSDIKPMERLLSEITPDLPSALYIHLSPGLEQPFKERYEIDTAGENFKMALKDLSPVREFDTNGVIRLGEKYAESLGDFYAGAYPGNWFSPRMLQSGYYYGITERNRIIAVAGVHVFSKEFNVAALGNIAVDPEYRNRGIGRKVTAACCKALLNEVDYIGLNVSVRNQSAVALYKKLGFRSTHRYFGYRMKEPK